MLGPAAPYPALRGCWLRHGEEEDPFHAHGGGRGSLLSPPRAHTHTRGQGGLGWPLTDTHIAAALLRLPPPCSQPRAPGPFERPELLHSAEAQSGPSHGLELRAPRRLKPRSPPTPPPKSQSSALCGEALSKGATATRGERLSI
ncbi:unnamed protein product [Eretmochelys imbricata]